MTCRNVQLQFHKIIFCKGDMIIASDRLYRHSWMGSSFSRLSTNQTFKWQSPSPSRRVARPACFCQKVFWMMNSWRHLFSNAPLSLVFYLILQDRMHFFYLFLICPFSKAVTFNQHHIHDLFGGHFSHELTSPNLVCTTIVLKCAQHYESGTNDSLSSLFDHIWFVIPRWVCCSLSTYPSSIFWLVMATFIRLMLLLAIDSADFARFFCFEAGVDAL